MSSGYGVQWVGEAAAVFAVVSVAAVDFAELLAEVVDSIADDPDLGGATDGTATADSFAYSFAWFNYAVTVVYRRSDRLRLLFIDRVTINSTVAGINPYG